MFFRSEIDLDSPFAHSRFSIFLQQPRAIRTSVQYRVPAGWRAAPIRKFSARLPSAVAAAVPISILAHFGHHRWLYLCLVQSVRISSIVSMWSPNCSPGLRKHRAIIWICL
eukprot:COSAG01_NODE_3637_length_5841_cov_105.166493_1_plen_111_part_00